VEEVHFELWRKQEDLTSDQKDAGSPSNRAGAATFSFITSQPAFGKAKRSLQKWDLAYEAAHGDRVPLQWGEVSR